MIRTTLTIFLIFTISNIYSQCINAYPHSEDFESTSGVFSWQPVCETSDNCGQTTAPFQYNLLTGNGYEGSQYLKSHMYEVGDHIIENCFDLTSLSVPTMSFEFQCNVLNSLKVEVSTDNVTWIEVWQNESLLTFDATISLIEFKDESDLSIRIRATEQVDLDYILIQEGSVDLCYSYDAAGNRTVGEIIVNAVEEGEVVSMVDTNEEISPQLEFLSSHATLIDEKIINVYPNPTIDYITIESLRPDMSLPFEIMDMQGKVIFKSTLNDQKLVNVSDFIPGTYLLNVKIDNEVALFRIIKN